MGTVNPRLYHFVPFILMIFYVMSCHTYVLSVFMAARCSNAWNIYTNNWRDIKLFLVDHSYGFSFLSFCCCWLTAIQFIGSCTSLDPYKYENCITERERKIENKVLRMLAISFLAVPHVYERTILMCVRELLGYQKR